MSVFQQFRLDGRIALVTGAGRGIGLAIAQAFAEAGAKVAIQDIDLAVAESEAKKLTDAGATAIALGGDATKLDDVDRWVPTTREKLGGTVDILVNNASIQMSQKFDEWTAEQMENVLRANYTGPFRLCQQVVAGMKERKWGRILNVGSIQGNKGFIGMGPYSGSKAALHNLTRALARPLGEHGITVNAIAPGVFDTLRNKSFTEKSQDFNWLPLRRVGQSEDCAAIALLLCSDAGGYITGDIISVDGGMHL
jgi:2-hydroxycyclohexanecarboxyl-CoA dehydrogenase